MTSHHSLNCITHECKAYIQRYLCQWAHIRHKSSVNLNFYNQFETLVEMKLMPLKTVWRGRRTWGWGSVLWRARGWAGSQVQWPDTWTKTVQRRCTTVMIHLEGNHIWQTYIRFLFQNWLESLWKRKAGWKNRINRCPSVCVYFEIKYKLMKFLLLGIIHSSYI
jgi:hypothetical protein